MTTRQVALVFMVVAIRPAAGFAADYRLSQGQDFSDASRPQISPDGVWALFNQDAETDGANELYRAAVEGGDQVRLSAPLPAGQTVPTFGISPNSVYAVYLARQDDIDHAEIYAAPIAAAAGSYVKLNDPLAPGAQVTRLAVSPDSSRVVFAVDYGVLETRELWSATLDGSDLDPLVSLPDGREVHNWLVSPDSQYLLYVAEAENGTFELWRAPVAGGAAFKLSTDLPAGRWVGQVAVSPDSSEVAYIANRDGVEKFELFHVPMAGGTPQQISEEVAGDSSVGSPQFSPDGTRVVYALLDDLTWTLWSVEPDGGGSVQLNGALTLDGSIDGDFPFRISPTSMRVVYLADQQVDEQWELYSVALGGGAAVKLNGQLSGDRDVYQGYAISPDDQFVVYRADQQVDGRVDVYAAPIEAGPGVRLSHTVPFGTSQVDEFAVSADGSHVFYRFSAFPLLGDDTRRLFSVPITGGPRTRIDGCDAAGENVSNIIASPADPRVALYIADQDTDEEFALHAGDICAYCNGFEGAWRWSSPQP